MIPCAYYESDPRWSAPDNMSVEHEVYDFLYGLVRVLKPELCFESGCYKGYSSVAIGKALLANGSGNLQTCDTDEEMVRATRVATWGLPVTVRQSSGVELAKELQGPPRPIPIDFAFLDSGGDRHAELDALDLVPGATIVVHDSRRYEWARGGLNFPTPRGLSVFVI